MKRQKHERFWNCLKRQQKNASFKLDVRRRTLHEFDSFVNKAEKILKSVEHEKSAIDCLKNLAPNKRPKLQHESVNKDAGSNV